MTTDYENTLLDETKNEEVEAEDRGDDFEPTPDDLELEDEAGGAGDEPPEDNATETSDEGEDGEDEGAKEPEETAKAIPQSRFNEVNQRYKEEREERLRLEEEVARLKGQSAQPQSHDQAPPVDLDKLEDQYEEAVMDGDKATAKALRQQIRQIEHAQIEQRALQVAQQQLEAREQAQESQRLAQVAAQIAQKYPELDSSSEKANSELIDMVLGYRDRLIAQGSRPADALARAAESIAQRSIHPAPVLKPAAAAPKIDAQKNLAREAQIPSRATGSRGARSQAVDYSSLSDEEFSKLSEEDLRRARGDFL